MLFVMRNFSYSFSEQMLTVSKSLAAKTKVQSLYLSINLKIEINKILNVS